MVETGFFYITLTVKILFDSLKGALKEIIGVFKAFTLFKNVNKRKGSSYGSRRHTHDILNNY